MKYNRRREINISYKAGASVKSTSTIEEVSQLYNILESLYRTRVKLPFPGFSYFKNLYESKIGKIFIVTHESKIIGGAFCLYYEGLAIYTLYYAGIRDYDKKIFPTHLAIMGIIEFAVNNNLKCIDFMGAGKPAEDYGVRDFKLQFGGALVEHGRYLLILNPLLYKIGVLGLKLLSKL
jgi:lipid II:glycine glycyltransferase (peptidoglycan interpeptide bridge formation enzyme)